MPAPDEDLTLQEPVVLHYFLQLHTFSRSSLVHSTGVERVIDWRAIPPSSEATTAKRVSWCAHFAAEVLLKELNTDVPDTPLDRRPLLTIAQIDFLVSATTTITQNLLVDRTEFTMVGDTRGAEQTWQRRLQMLGRATARLQEMLGYARAYTQGIRSAAGTVGTTFFDFLHEVGMSTDALANVGEALAGVQA